MRYPASEWLEIIQRIEQSHLPVRLTPEMGCDANVHVRR